MSVKTAMVIGVWLFAAATAISDKVPTHLMMLSLVIALALSVIAVVIELIM